MKSIVSIALACLLPWMALNAAGSFGGQIACREMTEATMATLNRVHPIDQATLNTLNSFAYTSAAQAFQDRRDGQKTNACYAPLSLWLSLSLLGEGAVDRTKEAIESVIGPVDASTADAVRHRLTPCGAASPVTLAQSIWTANHKERGLIELRDGFREVATARYGADVFSVDFSTQAGMDRVAAWISKATGGQIALTIKPNQETELMLINAMALQLTWKKPFRESMVTKTPFHVANGQTVDVPMMYTSHRGRYDHRDGVLVSELATVPGGRVVFVLPDDGVDVNAIAHDSKRLKAALDGPLQKSATIEWAVPKTAFDDHVDAKTMLKALGLSEIFSKTARFDALSPTPLKVSQILQDTHVAFDTQGVKAAAVTRVEMEMTMAKPDDSTEKTIKMTLNRPYLFGIQNHDGLWLFIGVVNNPAT